MRKKTDICLLCKTNIVGSEESHIIPKCLGKELVQSHKNAGTKFFTIDSSKLDERPIYLQDTPKEKYLFCDECEDYFNVLETDFCNKFHYMLRDPSVESFFIKKYNDLAERYIECLTIDPTSIRLFLMSIIWRCAISSKTPLELNDGFEELMKTELLKFKTTKGNDLLYKLASNTLNSFPMVLITSDEKSDPRFNNISVPGSKNTEYFLYLNEYILFFTEPSDHLMNRYPNSTNISGTDNFKVHMVDNNVWTLKINYPILK